MADHYKLFQALDTEVAAITGSEVEQVAAGLRALKLPFDVCTDPSGDVLRALGVFHKIDRRGALPRPGSLVFDRRGRLFRRRVVRFFRPSPQRLLQDVSESEIAGATRPCPPNGRT